MVHCVCLADAARGLSRQIESSALWAAARYYRRARMLFAPNADLCRLLQHTTGRPCYRMTRGVDTVAFSPAHRDRLAEDRDFVLGFVGRLSVEKNIALLVDIQKQLQQQSAARFRFLIVGHGGEEKWLRERLLNAEFRGVLRGRELARAYANMDAFVFPSHTDTFGNAVLEALASGVPAIVTPDGGPARIVRDAETGFIRADDDFAQAIVALASDPVTHAAMRQRARRYALSASWDAVFENVYDRYDTVPQSPGQSCAGRCSGSGCLLHLSDIDAEWRQIHRIERCRIARARRLHQRFRLSAADALFR